MIIQFHIHIIHHLLMINNNKELADKIISLLEEKNIILAKEIKNTISKKIEEFAKEETIHTNSPCNCGEKSCLLCGE